MKLSIENLREETGSLADYYLLEIVLTLKNQGEIFRQEIAFYKPEKERFISDLKQSILTIEEKLNNENRN